MDTLIATWLVLAGAFFVSAAASAEDVRLTGLESWADSEFEMALQQGRFSALVVVVVDARGVVLQKAYGFEDPTRGQPADAGRTRFRVGSVTKTFTATAIARLIDAGRIDSLGQPVNDVLHRVQVPGILGRQITLWNLLTHQAGFEDTIYGFGNANDSLKGGDLARIMPEIVRPPGTESAYSNYSYMLLGAIVEEASGESYDRALASYVLNPLQMVSSGLLTHGSIERLAMPQVRSSDGDWRPMPLVPMSTALAPAGALYSTGTDMIRYLESYLPSGNEKKFLSPEMHYAMLSKRTSNHPTAGSEHSMGFVVSRWNGRSIIEHTGSWPGYRAWLAVVPAAGTGIFVAASGGLPQGGPEAALSGDSRSGPWAMGGLEIRAKVLTRLFGNLVLPKALTPRHDPAQYTGTYLSTRRPYTSLEALRTVLEAPLSTIRVQEGHDGTLSFNAIGGYRETADDTVSAEGFPVASSSMLGSPVYGFLRDTNGKVEELVPGYALANFEKVAVWRDPLLLGRLLPIGLAVSASGLLGILRLRRRLVPLPFILQGALSVLVMLSVYTGYAPGGGYMRSILMADTGAVAYLAVLANLMLIMTAVLAASLLWRCGKLRTGLRGFMLAAGSHDAIVLGGSIAVLWVFWQTNLLGWYLP